MKIGYFVETPVEKKLTGGSRSFLDLITQLIPMGIEPYVVVSEKWALTDRLEELGVPYITARMFRPFVGVTDKARFYRTKYRIKQVINARACRIAKKFFRDHGVQLVHINSQFCGLVGAKAARSLGLPYVYHIREYLSSDFGVEFYNKKEADRLISGANAIVAISNSIREFMQNKYPQANVVRIYNGLNAQKLACADTERFTEKQTKLVIVGRVTEAKNQTDAVEAVNILANEYGLDVKLYVVGYLGKVPYELGLKQYTLDHGIEENVEFVPFSNDPTSVTHGCDIGLMCSQAEAFGRVTVEYMLANLLTIGTDTGATPEIISHGEDGLLYALNDARGLAEHIQWAIENKEQANAMLMQGKKKAVAQFSIQATAENVHNLYQQIVEESGAWH